MNLSGIMDFEDVLEVDTPSEVESKIRTLYSAWDRLYQANKSNTYIQREYKDYKRWANAALKSTTAKVFASGTLKTLDSWQARYNVAYGKAATKAGPSPDAMPETTTGDSWYQNKTLWYIAGGVVIAALLRDLLK